MSNSVRRLARLSANLAACSERCEQRHLLAAVPFENAFVAPADALLGPGVGLGGVAYFFSRDSSAPAAATRAELWGGIKGSEGIS